jgi:hypothetical protein
VTTPSITSPNVRILPKGFSLAADDRDLRLPVPGEGLPDFSAVWARDAHWPGEGADPETGEGGFRDSLGILDLWMAQADARMREPMLPAHASDCPRCAPPVTPAVASGTIALPAAEPGPEAHPYPVPAPVAEAEPESAADEAPATDATAVLQHIAAEQEAAREPDATKVIAVTDAPTEAVPVVKEGESDE